MHKRFLLARLQSKMLKNLLVTYNLKALQIVVVHHKQEHQ
jgi:hypothetical protein